MAHGVMSRQNGRDQIRRSKSGSHQLARHVTGQVQKANHFAEDFIEQHANKIAKVGLVSGAVALAVCLLQRKGGSNGGGRRERQEAAAPVDTAGNASSGNIHSFAGEPCKFRCRGSATTLLSISQAICCWELFASTDH